MACRVGSEEGRLGTGFTGAKIVQQNQAKLVLSLSLSVVKSNPLVPFYT